MSYLSTTGYIDRYGEDELIQLTDRLGAGTVDAAVFERAAGDAAAEIDGYLAGRHALPLAHVPPLLVRIAGDIVRHRLYADAAPEEVRKRYEDARRLLESIANGRVSLGLPAAPGSTVGNLVEIAPVRKVFGGGLA